MTGLLPTSLREPRFSPDAGAVYRRALEALSHTDTPFLLGGAVAVNAHTGVWRDTKDLDLFARGSDVGALLIALESAGFEVEVIDPVWLAKAKRNGYFLDVIHRNANGTGPVEEDWWDNARPIHLFDLDLLVTPAEETLLSKMFVGFRNRWDASDILHIIYATGGNLDWDRIVRKSGDNWLLLLSYLNLYLYAYPSHAHFVPKQVWDTLLGRLRDEVEESTARRDAPFRGTMLDCVSFQVDVAEWGLGPDAREKARGIKSPLPSPDAPPTEVY